MSNPSQPTLRPCPECGGQRVRMPGFELSLGKRVMLGVQRFADLSGVVCLNCGHTSLYVDDLAAVRAEVQKNPQKYQF